ncbi:hypothetical protein D5086_033350 [Populus alba]|uniref:Uncharacterized protein n=2 Tax=Populus alba TaxID=43335 RepID=A0ACC4AGL2_POPAL|nr:putative MO25-like protein At5g47540 [Populus alba]TKS16553.1 putative MO25-like protein [Populus alba]
MGFSRIFLRNKTKEATPVEIVRETQRLLLCISSDHRLKQEEKKKTEADLKQEKKAAAALANNIRAMKSIAYGNDESSAVSRACAQLTEEFFRENTLLLLIVCLPKMTSEVQRDATQVVANLLRHKVQSRLIASEYLEKNTDVLDLLVAGCGNMDMAIQYGEMLRACLRHQSAARYVLESPAHLKKFFDYIQLRYFDIASDAALTLKELLTRHTYSLVPEFLSKNYEWFFADFNSKLLESSDYFTRMQATKLLGHMLLDHSNSDVMARYASSRNNLRIVMNLLRDSSKCIRIKAFGVFKLFAANQNRSSDVITVLVANRSKLLRFLADFKTDKEDECFEADKAQVMKEIAALDPRDQSHE